MMKKTKHNYLLILHYNAEAEQVIATVLESMKYRLKNKTRTGDKYELTMEIKVKNNDTFLLTRFKEIEGVTSATILEYNGEYMN